MSIFSYIKSHVFVASVIGVGVIIVAVIAGRAATAKPVADVTPAANKVTLVNAATFRKGNINVSADGIVQSHSQADLKSQTSAPVAVINVSIGSTVYAGQTILELSNADIRAQLAQAEAALATAQGQQFGGAVSLDSAKRSAVDKIRDAYNKSYDVVSSQLDPILYNNDGNGGRLQPYVRSESLNSEINALDTDLKNAYPGWKSMADSLENSTSTSAIEAGIVFSQKYLHSTDLLVGDVSSALNDAAAYATGSLVQSLTGWKTTVTMARNSISAATQALTAADMSLSTASASQNTTAVSGVSAAQAGVSNLQAQLAKTVIRSPITGKIAALPLREGELASLGTLLATVVGDSNNLEIKAYASGDDLSRLKVGQIATIESSAKGTVSNVAPSIDAVTKRGEVHVEVADSAHSGLVVGENVSVLIATGGVTQGNGTSTGTYILPIQDVKIIPGEAYVFTVDQNSRIQSNPVTLGQIQGDFVEVTGGLSDDMNIVTPVYELDPGQTVTVQ